MQFVIKHLFLRPECSPMIKHF